VRSSQFFAPRFQWFLLPAIALLLLDALLANTAAGTQAPDDAGWRPPRAAAVFVGALRFSR
jgi:hypothetical protein